jgi:hypothetical protein
MSAPQKVVSKTPNANGQASSLQELKQSHVTPLSGWNIPEEVVREEAYKLWESGHSKNPDDNWFEAERSIMQAVSK